MKHFFSILLCCTLINGMSAYAQKFAVDTLQYQGTTKNMVNLVILSDGYTHEQLGKFVKDAGNFKEYLFNQSPYNLYRAYFNVFIIKVPSLESGVKHDHNVSDCPTAEGADTLAVTNNQVPYKKYVPKSNPNNYFGSSFDNGGLHRLVIAKNQQAIREVLNANLPEYTQTIILANSPYYGGSGGVFPTATVNKASNEIAIHELGHSFANLADEYWAGIQYLGESLNQTQSASLDQVPWKKWLGTPDIGVFGYGAKAPHSVWYRPSEFCKMQYLIAPFCSVCTEGIIEKIHAITNPIISAFPENTHPLSADSLRIFKINTAKPSTNTLKVQWFLNDELIAVNIDSIRINPGALAIGNNTIRTQVTDTTALVKTDEHHAHVYEQQWTINNKLSRSLNPPLLKWDSIQTTFGREAMLSIRNPEAGLQYYWYAKEKGRRKIAKGTNVASPKITAATLLFVESRWKKQRSARTAVTVIPLQNVAPPEDILIEELTGDTTKISIKNPSPDLSYRWYTSATVLKPISSGRRSSPAGLHINRKGTELTILTAELPKFYHIEAISIKNTAFSTRKSFKIIKTDQNYEPKILK